MKPFFLMMAVQFIAYLNLTFNFRAVAHAQYWVIAITDGLASAISVFIVQRISNPEKKPRWTWAETGMVVGGATAGVLGTWLTRAWS
jgi:hypothetical protein